MRSRRLYVINQSTLVSNDEVYEMVQACNAQLRDHVAPAWERTRVVVEYHRGTLEEVQVAAEPGSWVQAVVDKPDQPGVLGWHWMDDKGRVYGFTFAEPCLNAGGTALQGTYAVSAVLSHEVVETFLNPFCNGWYDSGRGFLVASEGSDPVEADTYDLGGVTVSNFIRPEYFDPHATAKFDYLGKLTQPFSMSPGGYWIQAAASQEEQKFAAVVDWEQQVGFDLHDQARVVFSPEMPEWRRQIKLLHGRNVLQRSLA